MEKQEFEKPDTRGDILVSMWIGAVIIWLARGFRGRLKDQLVVKNNSLNMWVGYIAQMVVVFTLVYFAFRK